MVERLVDVGNGGEEGVVDDIEGARQPENAEGVAVEDDAKTC